MIISAIAIFSMVLPSILGQIIETKLQNSDSKNKERIISHHHSFLNFETNILIQYNIYKYINTESRSSV